MIASPLTLLTIIEKAEIVVITTAVLLVLYIMHSLNLFKKE